MIFNDLLRLAADRYGFDKAACSFITDGREKEKRLYSFFMKTQSYVLRLVKTPASAIHQTIAEMDWLLYLAGQGAAVPAPLKTRNGELAFSEEEDGAAYIVSAFQMMNGKPWDKNDPCLWNKDVFYNWGGAVGELHRLTKDYAPAKDLEKRCEFQIRGMIGENIRAFPSVHKIAEELLCEIEALPKGKDSYGLIHNDLHPGNFLIDSGHINLFDFDGCAYSWYAFDIANALYLALWLGRSNDRGADFTNEITRYFLKGYLSANPLDNFWLSKIPLFMMVCKIALFSLGCDCENPGNPRPDDSRQQRIFNIENRVLFTGCAIDYALFKNI